VKLAEDMSSLCSYTYPCSDSIWVSLWTSICMAYCRCCTGYLYSCMPTYCMEE